MEAVLASGIFDRAPLLSRFFVYICEKYFAGKADEIKEYTIATEALGRPPDFDHSQDSIVRVQAHRLRRRLKQYYEGRGAGHELRIEIPSGQYAPVFRRVRGIGSPAAPPPVAGAVHQGRANTRRWLLAAVTAAIIVTAGATIQLVVPRDSTSQADAVFARSSASEPPNAIRIASGHEGIWFPDNLGRIWGADRYFTGGRRMATVLPEELAGLSPKLFSAARVGQFEYAIPLEPGLYELRLYFADIEAKPPKDFDILVNGEPILQFVDIAGDAGGKSTADVRVFTGLEPAADGRLHLSVARVDGILHGLEILPAFEKGMWPIRILAGQESGHHDSAGHFWSPDHYYRGGRTSLRSQCVSGTPDPNLYLGERYGRFCYVLPAAPGRYRLRLRFAETWFKPGNPRGSGSGMRVFDVVCNGVKLLEGFDIAASAGGSDRAVVKEFRGLEPDANGKIVIQFTPIRNEACVNAIELVPDSGA